MTPVVEFTASWRVALRIARRSAWRHGGRSALVVLMLFVPAYAATVLLASWANLSGTSTQEVTFSMGRADLIVEASSPASVAAPLPPGSRTVPLVHARAVVRTPAGLRVYDYQGTDPLDPLN